MGDWSTVCDMEGAVANDAVGLTLTVARRMAVVVADRWNAGAGERKPDAAARPLMSTRVCFIVDGGSPGRSRPGSSGPGWSGSRTHG